MRRLTVLGVAIAAVAALTPAAYGEPSLSRTGEATFPDQSFVLTLPAGKEARAGQIKVTENGAPVSGLKVEPVDAAARKRLGVVLVVDTSRSMSGEPVTEAFAAARAFAAERNEEQPIALITFNSESTVSMPLTTDPFEIQEGLARPPATQPETHLYDATVKATEVIRDADLPSGFVVVLSDGADFGSDATLASAAQAARDAHARIYTVGLASPKFDPDALTTLADSAGGTYSEAGSPQDLRQIYSTLSAELSNAYLLQYHSVVEPRTKVAVEADVRGFGSASAAYTSPRLGAGPAGNADDSSWSSPGAVALAVAVIVAIFGTALLMVLRRRRQTPRERVEQFVSAPQADEESLTARLASSTERSLSGTAWWQRFREAVDVADLPWDAARLLTNALVLGAAVGLFLAAVTGQLLILFLCVGMVPIVLTFVVRSRVARQRRAFGEQLADHLAVVGSTLRAGHSFPAALATGVEDAPEPTRHEFGRAVADERLGKPLNEALEDVARRMDSRDVDQVALLALLQREVGADAAEMLDGVVTTIRERQELRRTVRTLTAQGRLTRGILTALPIAVLLGLSATNPDYLDPLFHTSIGRTLLIAAAAMVVMGSLAIRRIVNFEI